MGNADELMAKSSTLLAEQRVFLKGKQHSLDHLIFHLSRKWLYRPIGSIIRVDSFPLGQLAMRTIIHTSNVVGIVPMGLSTLALTRSPELM